MLPLEGLASSCFEKLSLEPSVNCENLFEEGWSVYLRTWLKTYWDFFSAAVDPVKTEDCGRLYIYIYIYILEIPLELAGLPAASGGERHFCTPNLLNFFKNYVFNRAWSETEGVTSLELSISLELSAAVDKAFFWVY